MKLRSLLLCVVAALVAGTVASPLSAAIRYVNQAASGGNNGTSWANAYRELASALNAASAGDEIWVATGIYKPDYDATTGTHTGNRDLRFVLKGGVSVYGGFAGSETARNQRNWATDRVILSGDIGTAGVASDNTRTLMATDTTVASVRSTLDGLVFANGRADNPAELGNGDISGSGGALYVRGGSLTIANCVFVNNYAVYGGAIFSRIGLGQELLVEQSLFANNSALYVGGAIDHDYQGLVLRQSTLVNNSSSRGAAVGVNLSTVCTYQNNIIHSNTSTSSGWSVVETGLATTDSADGNILQSALTGIDSGASGQVVASAGLALQPSAGADGLWGTMDDVLAAALSSTSPALGAAIPALAPKDRGDEDGDGNTTETLPFDLRHGARLRGAILDAGAFAFINLPATAITLSGTGVAENLPAGSTVGTLATVDPDGGTFVYTLVAGAGDTDNARFSISGTTLLTAASLDYETTPTLSVRVRSTDSLGVPFEQALTIPVLDRVDPTLSDFTLAQSTLPIALVPAANQSPVRIKINPALTGFDYSGLQVISDSSWVSGAIDATTGELALSFATSALLNSSYTATLTIRNANVTQTLSISATLAPFNLVTLQDDPARSRMYGVHQNGDNQGAVVAIDPLTGQITGTVSVGNRPADLAVRADGQELLVICGGSREIYVINPATLTVTGKIALTTYDVWGAGIPAGKIAYGPAGVIYYVDGAWGPVLRVLKRSTGQVIQTLVSDGTNSTSSYGFGDIAVNAAQNALYAWVQYGWSAGYAGSYIVRHTINADGTLTYAGKNNASYPDYNRDPLNTPTLVSQDGTTVVAKTLAVDGAAITTTKRTFSAPIYSMTPNAEIVGTETQIIDMTTGNSLASLPASSTIQAITSDYARLVYFNATTRQIGTVNLIQIGADILARNLSPLDGAVVTAPSELRWSPVPGVDRYQVYLGLSRDAVSAATNTSPLYLGEVQGSSLTLSQTLQPGVVYYWRVDPVTSVETTKGAVRSFTVASISTSVSKITGATVKGHKNFLRPVALDSAAPGVAWSASSPASWISFANVSGTTPATLQVRLDASALAAGVYTSKVVVTTPDGPVELPVEFTVDSLTVTALRSRPGTTFAYAISEAAAGSTTLRAYLLELDALQKTITRAVAVGRGVTDFAIHEADQRVYVTNWDSGALLAVSLGAFTVDRTYAFSLPGSFSNDVYRVSPAGAGRVIFEAEDQWINIGILNTVTGTLTVNGGGREGGGATDPTGRYYYHGENNISTAGLVKFDTIGNTFQQLAKSSVSGLSYYGSRTVVASENGNRIFYNGLVFSPDLALEWNSGAAIYSASADGRYAFSDNAVFDIQAQRKIGNLPLTSAISAYNSATGRLVLPQADGFLFYSLAESGLTGSGTTPERDALVSSPELLAWPAMPAATAYRVYLGTSLDAVTAATPASPEYLGQVTNPYLALANLLAPGLTYYWRIDYVVGSAFASGPVQSFRVVTVAPSPARFDIGTVQGDITRPISIALSSSINGEAWSAVASAPWIQLVTTSGVTPATLRANLAISSLPAGASQGQITVTYGTETTVIPVAVTLDPLTIKYLESATDSALVYAISETTTTDGASRAYLLEIDSTLETITDVVRVGTGVTDLTIHKGDNRVYVTNWRLGRLYAVNRDTFTVDRIYEVPPFAGVGYSDSDVYVTSAGGPGRLIVEAQDQWIDVSIFNTVSGQVISTINERQGGGAHDPSGRYYYHGDDNSSGAEITKYDTIGDTFASLATIRVSSASYYGSRVVTVSADGSRVFWNGTVFDANLSSLWTVGQHIYSTTPNGRFALGETAIYDTIAMQAVLGMPVSTKVSAYNATSDKIVVQTTQGLGFYPLANGATLPAPVLRADSQTSSTVALSWTERSLETGFTLQRRLAGATAWTDVSATLAQNSTTTTVGGLAGATAYEFRLKANAALASSDWSNLVSATTLAAPLPIPSASISAATTSTLTLAWALAGAGFDQIVIERASGVGPWIELTRLGAATRQFTDTGLSSGATYLYRLKTVSATASSAYSTTIQGTTYVPVAATAPALFTAQAYSVGSIRLTWVAHPSAAGHRIERRIDGSDTWTQVADIAAGTNARVDTGLTNNVLYWYRITAYNDTSAASSLPTASALASTYAVRLADEFTGAYSTVGWQSVTGGAVENGTPGFGGSEVLRFSLSTARVAATIPLDLSAGGRILFKFRAGNTPVDGATHWENADTGENVALEYSANGGAWVPMQTIMASYPNASSWGEYVVEIPLAAQTASTALRWRQLTHSGTDFDTWALDSVLVQTLLTPPSPPASLATSSVGDTQIALTWSAGAGAANYLIERSLDGANWTSIASPEAASLSYSDTGAMPGTWYAYRVRSANAAGTSVASPVSWSKTFTQLEHWTLSQYGTLAPIPAASLMAAGADNRTNLEKFALGLPASQPAPLHAAGTNLPGLPAVWVDSASGRLRIEFLRRKASGRPGITYDVQFSSNLVDWTSINHIIELTSVSTTWERVALEDSVPVAGPRFVRIKVNVE